jgi:hypothetical protein
VVSFLLPVHRSQTKHIAQEKHVSRPGKINGTGGSLPLIQIIVNTNKLLGRGGKKIIPTIGKNTVLVVRIILKRIVISKELEIKNG